MRVAAHYAHPSQVKPSATKLAYLVRTSVRIGVRTGVRQGGRAKREPRALEMCFGGTMKCLPAAHRKTVESASSAHSGDSTCPVLCVMQGARRASWVRTGAGPVANVVRRGFTKTRKPVASRAPVCSVSNSRSRVRTQCVTVATGYARAG